MLPHSHKFTSSSHFDRTIRRGRRGGSRRVVVHYWDPAASSSLSDAPGLKALVVTLGGPRFGFIVSKAVGNAVARHGLTRKLRGVCAELMKDPDLQIAESAFIVVRALPAAASASSEDVRADIVKALKRARK